MSFCAKWWTTQSCHLFQELLSLAHFVRLSLQPFSAKIKSEIFSVLPETAFSIKIITEMLVRRDLWRSVVQPPTERRTVTSARAGQLWLHVAASRKLPRTDIHHLWQPVPVLQQPPREEILPAVPPELPKLKSVATALCFSKSSSSRDPC